MKEVGLEEEDRIKAQRLNVEFSRARECVQFVLSKDLTEYSGSVGEALRHYWLVLNESRKGRSMGRKPTDGPAFGVVLDRRLDSAVRCLIAPQLISDQSPGFPFLTFQ